MIACVSAAPLTFSGLGVVTATSTQYLSRNYHGFAPVIGSAPIVKKAIPLAFNEHVLAATPFVKSASLLF